MDIVEHRQSFCQINPYQLCRRNAPRHRCWRCSIECYRNAAYKEYKCQFEVLTNLPEDYKVYFGTLTVARDQSETKVLKNRIDFLKLLRLYAEENGIEVCKLRGVTEIGERSGRHHHHYCIYSSGNIDKKTIQYLWSEVTPAGSTRRVDHGPPHKGIVEASKYMWKFDTRFKVLLPLYGSIDVTWGSRRFFRIGGKVARWEDYKLNRFAPADPQFFSV